MALTVSSWDEFRSEWSGSHNFFMKGETVPFQFDWPPLEKLVEHVRNDEKARIWRGASGDNLDRTDVSDWFRSLPIDEALKSPVQMSHFALDRLTGPGQVLEGLHDQIVEPWQQALTAHGFTWERMNPIIFLSGPGCHTNYHIDGSYVLAVQVHGTKVFCALKDPERWAPREVRRHYAHVTRPEGITEADIVRFEMKPGDVLWNPLLIPHWVYAADETAYSLNISHGGIRCDGILPPRGREIKEIEEARNKPVGK